MLSKACLLALSCLLLGVSAQVTVSMDGQAPGHPLTNMPEPGDVVTSYFFPEFPTKQFPVGEVVSVVLGLRNEASEIYNISAVMGSLNSPTDFSIFVQNFTQQTYHQGVNVGQEISVEYKFMPDPRLEPRDFVVALTVFYQDAAGKYYSNTFFNQTIEIVEKKKLIDTELLGMILIFSGIFAALGYLVMPYFQSAAHSVGLGKRKAKKVEVTQNSADNVDEWVQGTPYDSFRKRSVGRSKAPSKKQ